MKLPRLPLNYQKQPELLERYWDRTMSSIESLFDKLLAVPAIQDYITQLQDVTAQATEVIASSKADNSLVTSFVQSAAPVLSADSTGVVTILTHTRVYGDSVLNPNVTVNGGTLNTGATSGQKVRVYYVDVSRTGGPVTYQYTIDPTPAKAQSGETHSVAAVIIPASGSVTGLGLEPPGYLYL
jgi:hypothetical protein